MSTSIGTSQSLSSVESVVLSTAGFGVVTVDVCTTSDVVDTAAVVVFKVVGRTFSVKYIKVTSISFLIKDCVCMFDYKLYYNMFFKYIF